MIFYFSTLSRERIAEIKRTGEGSYTYELKHVSTDALENASRGYSRAFLERINGKTLVMSTFYDEEGITRVQPLPEQFTNAADRRAALAGSFRRSALSSRTPAVNNNRIFDAVAMCTDCGRVFHAQPAAHTCGTYACSNCGNDLNGANCTSSDCVARRFSFVHSYHGRPHKCAPLFEKPDKRDTVPHFGAEIELEGNSRFEICGTGYYGKIRELSDAVNSGDLSAPLVEFERDGSLNDGVECITRPLTFSGFEKRKKYIDALYEKARELGAGFDRLNGLHFHIDRRALGADAERRALSAILIELMLYKYFDFFATISGRARGHFGYACKKDGIDGVFTACTRASVQAHSYAVNGEGSQTVEIRIFGGKIDTGDAFFAALDIVQAVAKWASRATIGTADKATPCDLVKHLKNHKRVLSFVQNTRTDAARTATGDACLAAFVEELKKTIEKKGGDA